MEKLLKTALLKSASDLHLSPGLPPILRVHGELKYLDQPNLISEHLNQQFLTLLNRAQQEQLAISHQIDFALSIPGLARFRVNIFKQRQGLSGVFRVVPIQIPSLDELEMPPVLKKIVQLAQGLVLITGATGSGKSTTLAAMIRYVNETSARHIITIEDPIEFIYSSQKSLIHQREIQCDTLNFDSALQAALREDPDMIVIGELRNLETVRLALIAAETGHLVLATLHTASASKTINRIIDVFPGEEKNLVRSLLAETLQAVIAQTLVKKVNADKRIAAMEIMITTPAIQNLIRENKIAQIPTVIQTNKLLGMQLLEQHLKELGIYQEALFP